jgi:hypothetical protein
MAKFGPDPKGVRTQFTARLPTDHLERYKAEAESCRLTLTDYLAVKLAEAHDLPEPEYIPVERERQRKRRERERQRKHAEELPISA